MPRCRRRPGRRRIASRCRIHDNHPGAEMTDRNLIFDVGANDGVDTAYYLGLGHSVVAVEADPSLCDRIRGRFAQEIADRRVTVVNAAVTEEDRDKVVLYISKDNTGSSLIRLMAERSGSLVGLITVMGRSLCSL